MRFGESSWDISDARSVCVFKSTQEAARNVDM